MAENNQTSGRQNRKKSSGSKRNRRRYFRRKNDSTKKSNSSSDKRKRDNDSQRRARRNRRRRRSGDSKTQSKVAPVISAIENDYVAPTSFFAYTHIVRSPETRDGYEYRPERFAGGGRKLEDFRIDLSPLFDPPTDTANTQADGASNSARDESAQADEFGHADQQELSTPDTE